MIVGETQQASLFFETELQGEKAEIVIREIFSMEEDELSVLFGPIRFAVHTVDNAPRGCKALVGEAEVLEVSTCPIDTHWLMDLQPSELKILREITQKAYKHCFPKAPDLMVHNLDQIIANQGPQIRDKLRAH